MEAAVSYREDSASFSGFLFETYLVTCVGVTQQEVQIAGTMPELFRLNLHTTPAVRYSPHIAVVVRWCAQP